MKRNREAHKRKPRTFVWMPMQRITVERPHVYDGILKWLDDTVNDTGEVMRLLDISTYGWERFRVTRSGYHKRTGVRVLRPDYINAAFGPVFVGKDA